jgi:bifunctional non-homologous end joining protein LigD
MLDRLRKYRAKRDFSRTVEPSGAKRVRVAGKHSYLIQKHDARATHFDFRLEHDGALLSWAIPKGPSLDPADKRLAVHVEDHPVEYGTFEGTIPKGQYGGGTVMLWDRGSWEPHGDVDEGLKKGRLAFDLHGERLHGGWALVRLRGRGNDRRDNWLLVKEKDAEAKPGRRPLTETATTSIATGRSMDEIARGNDVWQSNRAETKATTKTTTTRRKAGAKKKSEGRKAGAGTAKIPPFVEPQLATLVDAPPAGGEWLHEIKYDGYRVLASMAGDNVVMWTRRGLDWTDKFQPLIAPLTELPCRSALLDGEVAVADAEGHTDFGALQNALSEGSGRFGYYLFDILHLDGEDLRSKSLSERKEILKTLLAGVPRKGPLFFSDHLDGEGAKVFAHACDLKLEGIISKRADDRYHSGRTRSWLKIKCGMEQEFVIVGWRPSTKAGRPFSSLLLAVRDEGELRYAGRVGTGYTEARLEELAAKFRTHARATPPVSGIPRPIARHAHFLEPVLVAEIAFRGWTRDGLVRQGSFKGLRADKPARAVVREHPMPVTQAVGETSRAKRKVAAKPKAARAAAKDSDEIAGVHITHPDRVMFAAQGITKRELADYYVTVADRMLPHIAGRPLALVRCPQGSGKECFFQKHASPGWPDLFKKVVIKEKTATREYLYIEDASGLVAAAQMGVLELHLWGSHADEVDHPDRMVFDLDPDEGLDFAAVKDAARDMKQRLADAGLESFPMLTGGKGVHVVVPLKPGHSWDEHRAFAEAMARLMAEQEPERYVANMSKKKRRGKIFVDYLRNTRGATAIAPYSTRARPGAFVALPLSWAALARAENAHPVSVADAAKKIARAGDPWPGYFKLRQALPLGK